MRKAYSFLRVFLPENQDSRVLSLIRVRAVDAMVGMGREEKDNLEEAARRRIEATEKKIGAVASGMASGVSGMASGVSSGLSHVVDMVHHQKHVEQVVVVTVNCPRVSGTPPHRTSCPRTPCCSARSAPRA